MFCEKKEHLSEVRVLSSWVVILTKTVRGNSLRSCKNLQELWKYTTGIAGDTPPGRKN